TAGWVVCSRMAARETLRSAITVWKTLMRYSSILSKTARSVIRMPRYLVSAAAYTPSRSTGVSSRLFPDPRKTDRMDTPTRPIRFFHAQRGGVADVAEVAPTRSVLNWLREDARCVGTKEGCNEGDCGACTVIVAELAEDARCVGTRSAEATIV